MVAAVDVVISVCPPAAAVEVAEQVSGLGFDGLYVDVNAVSPATARQISLLFSRFLDGGVVGPPPSSSRASQPAPADPLPYRERRSGGTRLYLSGREASDVEALFTGSVVDTRVVGSDPGRASALKMTYAARTKGTSALPLSVAALATSEEVMDELLDEWDMSIPELRETTRTGVWANRREGLAVRRRDGRDSPHPWRRRTSGRVHLAAADIYSRLAGLKDHSPSQSPGEVLDMLLHKSGEQRITS